MRAKRKRERGRGGGSIYHSGKNKERREAHRHHFTARRRGGGQSKDHQTHLEANPLFFSLEFYENSEDMDGKARDHVFFYSHLVIVVVVALFSLPNITTTLLRSGVL